jgi:hypothetical protein
LCALGQVFGAQRAVGNVGMAVEVGVEQVHAAIVGSCPGEARFRVSAWRRAEAHSYRKASAGFTRLARQLG